MLKFFCVPKRLQKTSHLFCFLYPSASRFWYAIPFGCLLVGIDNHAVVVPHFLLEK